MPLSGRTTTGGDAGEGAADREVDHGAAASVPAELSPHHTDADLANIDRVSDGAEARWNCPHQGGAPWACCHAYLHGERGCGPACDEDIDRTGWCDDDPGQAESEQAAARQWHPSAEDTHRAATLNDLDQARDRRLAQRATAKAQRAERVSQLAALALSAMTSRRPPKLP